MSQASLTRSDPHSRGAPDCPVAACGPIRQHRWESAAYHDPVSERVLAKGENAALPEELKRVQVLLSWSEDGGAADVDAAALVLNPAGKVRDDGDFVFYNQPQSVDGSVLHLGRSQTETGVEERIAVSLEDLAQDVGAVAVTASSEGSTFGDVRDLSCWIVDESGAPVVRYDVEGAGNETAFVLAEIYRRNGAWKVRAVGQGWDTGLAGLATDFGVTVDETSAEPEPVPEDQVVAQVPADEGSTDEPPADTHIGEAAAEGAEAGQDESAAIDDGLTDVSSPEPSRAEAQPRATRARRSTGVRTKKAAAVRNPVPALVLAGDDSWQPARIFSISGVGNAEEQEKRATSALLATMMAVRPFGRAIATRFGAPAGALETFLEVAFPKGEGIVYPDGVIRVARAGRVWTGLLEVKTSTSALRREQVENYLDVARDQGFDAVITLSNEISPGVGEHPVPVDKRKLRKVSLHHMSWTEVLHEARVVLQHRGVPDPTQAWLLSEFIRYLDHPRSGAATFEDMGANWVPVREAVSAGTLRSTDRKVPAVADAWSRLVRHLCLRLSAELGVQVTQVLPRKLASDPAARNQAIVSRLVADGVMEAQLRIPGAAGLLAVTADLRTSEVRVCMQLGAPQEGTAQRRVSWLLRQLKEAPGDVLVEVRFSGRSEGTCERLVDVRDNPQPLLPDKAASVSAFVVSRTTAMGTKRSGIRGAFVPSVTSAVETFYAEIVQSVRGWTPPAPKLPDDVAEAALDTAAEIETTHLDSEEDA